MFIPVSLTTGPTHVDVTIDISGSFIAACPILYEGQGYVANTEIQVERTKTVRLTTEVTGYKEISVRLAGKQYYWHVDVPKTLRYVDDDAYKRVTGSVRGTLLNTETGVSIPYQPTAQFSGGDTVASIDFGKKEVWFFNTSAEVKRVTLTDTPVSVLFLPRWSTVEGITTVCYVVTDSTVVRMTAGLDIDEVFPIDAGVVAASGDVKGMLVLAYENRLVQWRDNVIEATIIQPGLIGIHSIFVAPDNTYVVGCTSGIMFVWRSETEWLSDIVTSYTGRYWAFDITSLDLYAVDAFNRCLVRINLAERTYSAVYYDKVPRDVVVTDDGDVYVSFLNDATALKYDAELTTSVQIPAKKSFGAAYLNEYWVTDLYSDAVDVTKPEPSIETNVQATSDIARNEEFIHRWTVDWDRPEFVRLGTTNAVVRVNGNVFTQGYLRKGDSVSINLPATDGYYDDRYVSLIGRRSVVFQFRTVPKLFPDYVVVDPVLSAFLKVQYEEMFEVTGMTWGFDVAITLDSVDVQFAVNDGEFGTTGRIQNGDIVHLVGSVKSLIAKRTAHQIITQYNEPVAEWTLLPMLLDGSTKRTASTVKKDKFAHLFESNSSSVGPTTEPVAYPSITSLSTDTYAAQGGQLTFGTVSVNGECAPSIPCYTIDDARYIVQPSLLTAAGSNTFEVLSEPSVYDFGSMFAQGAQRTAYILESEIKAGGGLRTQGTTDYFVAATVSVSLNTTHLIATTYERRIFDVYDTIMEFTHRPVGYVAYMDAAYLQRQAYTVSWAENDVENYTLTSDHSVNAAYGVALESERPSKVMNHFRFTAFHKEQFVSEVDTFWNYPVSEFGAAAEQRVQKNRYPIGASVDKRPLATHWEFGADPALRLLGVFVEISASYALRPNASAYAVHTAYVRKPNSTRHAVQTAAARRINNVRTFGAPQAVFVHSRHSQHHLSDEHSGFGSLEQAQAYAATLNLEENTPAQFIQYDNSWIVISSPVADNAACFIVERPTLQQRRFGYAGGG